MVEPPRQKPLVVKEVVVSPSEDEDERVSAATLLEWRVRIRLPQVLEL